MRTPGCTRVVLYVERRETPRRSGPPSQSPSARRRARIPTREQLRLPAAGISFVQDRRLRAHFALASPECAGGQIDAGSRRQRSRPLGLSGLAYHGRDPPQCRARQYCETYASRGQRRQGEPWSRISTLHRPPPRWIGFALARVLLGSRAMPRAGPSVNRKNRAGDSRRERELILIQSAWAIVCSTRVRVRWKGVEQRMLYPQRPLSRD